MGLLNLLFGLSSSSGKRDKKDNKKDEDRELFSSVFGSPGGGDSSATHDNDCCEYKERDWYK